MPALNAEIILNFFNFLWKLLKIYVRIEIYAMRRAYLPTFGGLDLSDSGLTNPDALSEHISAAIMRSSQTITFAVIQSPPSSG